MQSTRRIRPLLTRAAQLVLFVLIAWFIVQYLRDQSAQIQDATFKPDGVTLGLAQVSLVIGLLGLPFGSWLVLRAIGYPLEKVAVWQIFYVSLLTKYLPGSIWSLPSRSYLYTQRGVPTGHSVVSVFWETALMVSGAVAVSLLGISTLTGSAYLGPVIALLIAGSVGLIGGGLALQSGPIRARLAKLPVIGRVFRLLVLPDHILTVRQLLLIGGYYALNWLVLGAGFAGTVAAFKADLTPGEWVQFTGLFAGAWVVGFLVIVTPGGIGVRDTLLVAGLSGSVPDPEPLVIAVLARIGWTLAEITGTIVVRLWVICHNNRSELPDGKPYETDHPDSLLE